MGSAKGAGLLTNAIGTNRTILIQEFHIVVCTVD